MQHSFDVNIAEKYGVIEAILINNFAYWILQKKANNENLYDGKYWVYNSIRAFSELYSYLSPKQIRRALDNLRDAGAVETACYNKDVRDRTLWYTLSEEVQKILHIDLTPEHLESTENTETSFVQNDTLHLPKKAQPICPNGHTTFAQKGEPLPYINTNIKHNINSSGSSKSSIYTARNDEPCVSQSTAATTAAKARDSCIKNTTMFWLNNTGQYGEVIRSDIADLVDKYGDVMVQDAMREAIRSNARNMKYVTAIVERRASGRGRTSVAVDMGAAFAEYLGGDGSADKAANS